jgi:formiminoglutamase
MTPEGSPQRRFTVAPFHTWEDVDEHRVTRWIQPLSADDRPDAIIIGAPFTSGNTRPTGSWKAPEAIRHAFEDYSTYSADYDVDLAPLTVRDAGDVLVHATSPAETLERISQVVQDMVTEFPDAIPVVLGGDHSVTAATLPGYTRAKPDEHIGLIYFDAHTDVRADQEGVALAGSPVRHMLQSCPNLSGANVVELGVHGFMNAVAHRRWAEEQGVTVVSARHVRERGIEEILEEAVGAAGRGTDSIYVSVDIDVLDLPYAIGAGGRISPGGVSANDLLDAMWLLGQTPAVRMVDFVEVDPLKDIGAATTRVAASLVLSFLGGMTVRRHGLPRDRPG